MSASVATAEVGEGVGSTRPGRQALGHDHALQSPLSSARYGSALRLAPMVDVDLVDVTPGEAELMGSGPPTSMPQPLASAPKTTMAEPLVDVNVVDVTPPLMAPAEAAAPDALPPLVDVDTVDVTPSRTDMRGASGAPSTSAGGGPRPKTPTMISAGMPAGVVPLTDVDTVDVTPPRAADCA
ncbi:hypothetical protein MMPV_004971 [Pyropia vietnamensis]